MTTENKEPELTVLPGGKDDPTIEVDLEDTSEEVEETEVNEEELQKF